MRINNNVSALNAWRNLYINDTALTKSMEKLSSGFRINRAGDDAAGLAISEKMRAQISGLNAAIKNAQDAISLIQTAEGALNEQQVIIRRMRDLVIQAANSTNTDDDVSKIQDEIDALLEEIDRIAQDTEFNTMKLLNGDFDGTSGTLVFQIGANAEQRLSVTIGAMTTVALAGTFTPSTGTATTVSLSQINLIDSDSGKRVASTVIDTFIAALDGALETVSAQRSKLGAVQNRLEHTINNLQVAAENLTAAESRIRDVDMAMETTAFVRNQILVQSATAMLAQANVKPQSVLQLLG